MPKSLPPMTGESYRVDWSNSYFRVPPCIEMREGGPQHLHETPTKSLPVSLNIGVFTRMLRVYNAPSQAEVCMILRTSQCQKEKGSLLCNLTWPSAELNKLVCALFLWVQFTSNCWECPMAKGWTLQGSASRGLRDWGAPIDNLQGTVRVSIVQRRVFAWLTG